MFGFYYGVLEQRLLAEYHSRVGFIVILWLRLQDSDKIKKQSNSDKWPNMDTIDSPVIDMKIFLYTKNKLFYVGSVFHVY